MDVHANDDDTVIECGSTLHRTGENTTRIVSPALPTSRHGDGCGTVLKSRLHLGDCRHLRPACGARGNFSFVSLGSLVSARLIGRLIRVDHVGGRALILRELPVVVHPATVAAT